MMLTISHARVVFFVSSSRKNTALLFVICCLFIHAASLPPKLTYMVKEEVRVHTFVGNVLLDVQFPDTNLSNTRLQARTESLSLYELSVQGANLFQLDSETADLYTSARIDREAVCPRTKPRIDKESSIGLVALMKDFAQPNANEPVKVDKCTLEFAVVRKLRGIAEEQWVSLTIEIEDVDDNAPTFLEFTAPDWSGFHNIWIREDIPIGYKYPLPNAFDADIGLNALINYRLEFESPNQMVKPIVLQPLDYEEQKEYRLGLIACSTKMQTNKSDIKCARLPVRVLVRDVNDNEPRLIYPIQSIHELTISESVSVGTVLLKVEATDVDDGEAGRLTYSLQSADNPSIPMGTLKNATQWITIDPSTGELRLARNVSAHDTPTFRIMILISDNGVPRKSTKLMLVIHISDANNHAPQIVVKRVGCNHEEDETNELVIDRAVETNNHVGLVFVSDADLDLNGMVDCWIEMMDNEIHRLFGIELKLVGTGKVSDRYVYMLQTRISTQSNNFRSMTRNLNLSDVEKPFTTMLIICADKGKPHPLTSSVKLTVTVVDRRVQELCFEQKSYTLHVIETNRPQTQLLRVQLQEISVRAQFRLKATVEHERPCQQFYLDPLNGALSTPHGIDREVAASFECLIVAEEEEEMDDGEKPTSVSDQSVNRRMAQAKLTVHVADVNDNAPALIPSLMISGLSVIEWDAQVMDTAESLLSYPLQVGTIIARDPDAGENGTITYQLEGLTAERADRPPIGVEIHLPRFDIHPNTGQVTLERDQHPLIDRELVQAYQLRVLLEDRGQVLKRSVITRIPIYVMDVNDNTPEWMPHMIVPNDHITVFPVQTGAAFLNGLEVVGPPMRLRLPSVGLPRLLQVTWFQDRSTGSTNEWLAEMQATDRDQGENARLTFYKLNPNQLSPGIRGHAMDLPNEALEIYSDGTMKVLSTFLNPNWLYMSAVLVQDNGKSRKLQTFGYFYVNLSSIVDTNGGQEGTPEHKQSQAERSKETNSQDNRDQPTATQTVFTEKLKLTVAILLCSGLVVILTVSLVCCILSRRGYPGGAVNGFSPGQQHPRAPQSRVAQNRTNHLVNRYMAGELILKHHNIKELHSKPAFLSTGQ
ncbi:unnamed protein product [Echinostoma caproni]|uniref:Cadherin domain-containing protein n=1 Tax=Echinostoma caproni TaxID=27848 RepID=A0A183ALY3_9TREM|nr:unnamed protein product [Echinostoma caproni]